MPECDFIVVAVKDSAVKEVLRQIQPASGIVLHTSGSHGMDVFPAEMKKFGVLYPFQSLTKGFETDFNKIPICIEASDGETLSAIENFAAFERNNRQQFYQLSYCPDL